MQYFSYSRSLLKLSIKAHHINLIEKFWGNCIRFFFPIKLTLQPLNRCPACPLLLTKLLCKLKSGLSGFGHQPLSSSSPFLDRFNLITLSPKCQAGNLEGKAWRKAGTCGSGPAPQPAGQLGSGFEAVLNTFWPHLY